MNPQRRRKLAICSSLREKESQARGDSHSPKWLVCNCAQSRQRSLCSQIIPTIKARNPKLLLLLKLKLKTEGELRIRNWIPKQRKQDSFHIQECGPFWIAIPELCGLHSASVPPIPISTR